MRGCVSIKYSYKREFDCPICEKHFDNMRTANRIKSRVKIAKMTLQTLLSCLIMGIFYREYNNMVQSFLPPYLCIVLCLMDFLMQKTK